MKNIEAPLVDDRRAVAFGGGKGSGGIGNSGNRPLVRLQAPEQSRRELHLMRIIHHFCKILLLQ